MENAIAPKIRWYRRWWGVLLLGIATLFLIFFTASAFYVYNQVKIIQANGGILPVGGQEPQTIYNAEGLGTNYWFGSDKPKVTIVIFADFSCPNCKNFNATLTKARIKYYNDLKIIFRDFPVISDASFDLALAGRCAGEQGLFWLMHDELYNNQGVTSQEEIYSLARQINADMENFDACFANEKYKTLIQKDLADGMSYGIAGTPTIFINGRKIVGDVPEGPLMNLIEQLTKE